MKPIPKHPQKSQHAAPAFTLIELMITITIIAVLVALSLFGYMKFRDAGDKAASMSNLRQLQIANMSYASDNNGRFVPITDNDDTGKQTRWFVNAEYMELLTGEVKYVGGSRKAGTLPVHMLDPKVVRASKNSSEKIYASYGMNANGLPLGSSPNLSSYYSMNNVTDPARSMAFATATDFRISYSGRFKWDFDDPNDSKTRGGELAYRHKDKILVVYFDGHVGEMSKADLQNIDRNRGGNGSYFWRPMAK